MTHIPFRRRCKTGSQTDMSNETFDNFFVTRITETELNNEKQEVQIRNISLLLDL
jgi:hypothetical protein